MATNWQIGDRIQNRWEIYKILRGGMGIVYVVYDHEFREAFAAKTFQDEIFARNPRIADRFTQESLTWVNLDAHQNITEARFVQTIAGKPLLFLEYVSGGDLSGWIGTPRLTEDLLQVLRFAIQFCDGMIHALSKGIKAHRDIKPQNCLVTGDGTLKVTDFGLARVAAMQEAKGGRGGTYEYMPPEQWNNFEQADEQADIYSFGAMLYAMLTGQPPFGERPGVSVYELERRHRNNPPPSLRIQDSALRTIIQTCLAKVPTCRFASFSAVRKQLAEIYETLTGKSAPQPVVEAELDSEQWNRKGMSLSSLGRKEEALACHDRALELNPNLVQAWSNKGATLNELRRNEQALACYNRAIELNPRYEKAWSNKGNALKDLGRNEEALACHSHALQLNPLFEKAWANKGIVLRLLGRIEEALACYDRALELDPRDEIAWCNKGIALGAPGRHDEALACFDRALAINLRLEQAWTNKGAALEALGRYSDALTCHNYALGLDSRDVQAWFNKGAVLGKLERLEEEIICYDRALEIDSRQEKAWLNKGIALTALRRHDEALPCFHRAVKLNPNYEKAWYCMGLQLALRRCFREALACFEEAHRLGHPQAAEQIALWQQKLEESAPAVPLSIGQSAERWFSKGVALTESRRWEESIACYDRALEINPRLAEAWHNKGLSLYELARSEEAVACYNQALALNPRLEEAWMGKGHALMLLGQFDEADTCYGRALALKSKG